MHVEEFVEVFARGAAMEPDHERPPAVQTAARILRRHVTLGDTLDVLSNLPDDIRAILV